MLSVVAAVQNYYMCSNFEWFDSIRGDMEQENNKNSGCVALHW